ncbi:hypothetical protein [Virgibacillus litoralis]|uniref:ABC-type amino acid transport system permease subunit n=1 Tax=Virgibacillus litoralis TaxID=578221 RepID=A0ABS4HHR6_9BACI|nr:hypothetical protein [Virgibacillus litoralis]MBP1950269.1 ABC-type amino acid transport system permease subunit [Virgibacillus litoralis]
MFILSLYLIIGVVICATQKTPEEYAEDKSTETYFMFLLLFLFICWPVVVIWRLGRRVRL